MNTKEYVCKLRLNNPCMTLKSIGDSAGVTRERVRQILSSNNLPTKSYRVYKLLQCRYCFKIIRAPRIYCSKECREKDLYIYLECEECGKLVKRLAKDYIWRLKNRNYKHVWCNKRCQGKWLGKNFGHRYSKGDNND